MPSDNLGKLGVTLLLVVSVHLLDPTTATPATATPSIAPPVGPYQVPIPLRAPAFLAGATTTEQDASALEASLNLDRPTRRSIQQRLRNEGFDPGTPDGLFGPRTRAAIRGWQEARGDSPTGYLDAAQVELLRSAAAVSEVQSRLVAEADASIASAPTAPSASSARVDSPPSIAPERLLAVERFLIQAQLAIRRGEHLAALNTFDHILGFFEETGLQLPPLFWINDAQVAHRIGLSARVVRSASRYLDRIGREGEHYWRALRLLEEAEARRNAEEAEARRNAEEAEARRNAEEAEARRNAEDVGRFDISQLRQLAEQGDVSAQMELGERYYAGRTVGRDYVVAVSWFRSAADQGYAPAQAALGYSYMVGWGVEQNDDLGAMWSHRGAEQGNARAQNTLGVMYRDGRGVAQDYSAAVHWFRQAAEQDTLSAQNSLAGMYRTGRGVTQDDQAAATWYRRAAEQGHTSAQRNLGYLYDTGQGVSRNYEAAASWYRLAAEQGDVTAQSNLAGMYRAGRGVTQDNRAAVTWYRRAAEQGDPRAQTTLGYLYDMGQGVSRNYEVAVSWYRRAAEQDNATAQHNLGISYSAGRGVSRDYQEAMKWFQRAAEQGNPRAHTSLGRMYEAGRGVAKDRRAAQVWYERAADLGHSSAFLVNFNSSQAEEFARRCSAVKVTQDINRAKFLIVGTTWFEVHNPQGDWLLTAQALRLGSRIDDVCEDLPGLANGTGTVADWARTLEDPNPKTPGLPAVFLMDASENKLTFNELQRLATRCSRVTVTANVGTADFVLRTFSKDGRKYSVFLYNLKQTGVKSRSAERDSIFGEVCGLL